MASDPKKDEKAVASPVASPASAAIAASIVVSSPHNKPRPVSAHPTQTPLTDEEAAFVRKSLPFELSLPEDVTKLIGALRSETYAPGDYCFVDGDSSDRCWVIVSGEWTLELAGRGVAHFSAGGTVGEVGLMEEGKRRAACRLSSAGAKGGVLLSLSRAAILSDAIPKSIAAKLFAYFGKRLASLISGVDFYRHLDVLLIQDGGCAPGYDTVTAFLTEYFELSGRQVFVARHGFRSIVSGKDDDYCSLVWHRELYNTISLVPRVIYAPPLRDKRGASFRSERYPEFKEKKHQETACANLLKRQVKTIVYIGGNGTFAGCKALTSLLPSSIQSYFIPVTIDRDLSGTECIGQHTAVECGAEKIRCYLADGETHQRVYIIEMMGAEGGFHALFSCIGAGADLAVLPHSNLDLPLIAAAIMKRKSTCIVVAEGYGRHEREQKGMKEISASAWLHRQLTATGLLDPKLKKIVTEPFSRDIRGAAPNNNDIALSQQMAKQVAYLSSIGVSGVMPTVLSGSVGKLNYAQVQTDNTVNPADELLADHLTKSV